jgi:hypothetical protein
VLVVAPAPLLGRLRVAVAARIGAAEPYQVAELCRDPGGLTAPALHEALARAGVLPPPRRPTTPWQTAAPR